MMPAKCPSSDSGWYRGYPPVDLSQVLFCNRAYVGCLFSSPICRSQTRGYFPLWCLASVPHPICLSCLIHSCFSLIWPPPAAIRCQCPFCLFPSISLILLLSLSVIHLFLLLSCSWLPFLLILLPFILTCPCACCSIGSCRFPCMFTCSLSPQLVSNQQWCHSGVLQCLTGHQVIPHRPSWLAGKAWVTVSATPSRKGCKSIFKLVEFPISTSHLFWIKLQCNIYNSTRGGKGKSFLLLKQKAKKWVVNVFPLCLKWSKFRYTVLYT